METFTGLDSAGERVRNCDRENDDGGVRSNQLIRVSKEFSYLRSRMFNLDRVGIS